jgi:hypothetical protein
MFPFMGISQLSKEMNMNQSSFLLEEPPVNPSQSQDSEADWMMTVVTWPSNFCALLTEHGPVGWFGRTSPASCRQMEDGTLVPLSGAWSNSGMVSHTESLTLNTLEWPSAADVCLLSDTLETGDVPQRFFLSKTGDVPQRFFLSNTACRGVLRRAEKRKKNLPPQLLRALLFGERETKE